MAKKKQSLDMSKEDMYRKIMPSIPKPEPEIAVEEMDEAELIKIAYMDTSLGNVSIPYNVMELVVKTKIGTVIDRLGVCKCEQCRNDSIALALNKLPPTYSGSDKESISANIRLIRSEYEVKVTSAIIQAVQAVALNPRH